MSIWSGSPSSASFRSSRMVLQRPDGSPPIATVHPSYLLRLPDPQMARLERERFVEDLALIRDFAQRLAA